MSRKQLNYDDFEQATLDVIAKLNYRREQKGDGSYASGHEIAGILDEELQEFKHEVHTGTKKRGDTDDDSKQRKIEELKDIAVGAIWGIASLQTDGVDW